MATKAKTKANRTAERKSSRSQTASRNKERQQASRNAFDVWKKITGKSRNGSTNMTS